MKAVTILLFAALLSSLHAAGDRPEPEYFCHNVKTNVYAPAYEGDRQECESDENYKFVTNVRSKFGWSCRYTDAIFYIGKKSARKQAEEACHSGQLKKI